MLSNFVPIAGVDFSSVSSGIKKTNTLDLSLITLAKGSVTAGVFTQNIFCAAPVIIAKNHLQEDVRALLINSGNANAGNGDKGLENCYESCSIFADKLDLKAEQIMPFSTGLIGKNIEIEKFRDNADLLVKNLDSNNIENAAKSILTTDTVEKYAFSSFEFKGETINIAAIAKGSGMIRPDMATMLCFIFTNISSKREELQKSLSIATNKSFNRITIDGDTSTNDACTLSATNKTKVNLTDCSDVFQKELDSVMLELAHKIVKDGEGATKFVKISVSGMKTQNDCLETAYTIANSLLVKTALFSGEANWGRILAAIGRANVSKFSIADVNIGINNLSIFNNGEIDKNYKEEQGAKEMQKKDINIDIRIGSSNFIESVWTCDLSYEYVKINSQYMT